MFPLIENVGKITNLHDNFASRLIRNDIPSNSKFKIVSTTRVSKS